MATATLGQTLGALQPGVFRTISKVKPMGALQARKQKSGAVSFFWRYSIGDKSERVPLGLYDSTSPPKSLTPSAAGYSVAAAERAAELLALEHHQARAEGGRPAIMAARHDAKRVAAEAKHRAAVHTLERLLSDYCDRQEQLGRSSHRDARSIFRLHVLDAFPHIAAMPANDVTSEDFADMMRKLIDSGKGRTANKLRSYARAAYENAKAAKSKPSIPVAFKAFGITVNPVADTEPDELQNKSDKRPLSASELRTYWRLVKVMPGVRGAALRFHLLTGGQRILQLVKLRTENIQGDQFTLYDGKGRPGTSARPHLLPLFGKAKKALDTCRSSGPFALSTDGGLTHIYGTTLSKWAREAASGQIADFQAKRIRSGVETILASVGVSRDVRGHLQSHGITGVQARHYDGHDYLPQKREALERLFELLETLPKIAAGKKATPR